MLRIVINLLSITLIWAISSPASAQIYFKPDFSTFNVDHHKGCSASFDKSINGQTVRIEPFPGNSNYERHISKHYNQLQQLMGITGLDLIELFFFDDSSSPNAWAISRANSGDRFTVLFGTSLLEKLQKPVPGTRDLNTGGVTFILGHELGHIAQYLAGANGTTRNMELMADELAGFYNGLTRTSDQELEGIRAAFNSGDFAFNDPSHHGTPAQRRAAFSTGLNRGNKFAGKPTTPIDFWEFFESAARNHNVSITNPPSFTTQGDYVSIYFETLEDDYFDSFESSGATTSSIKPPAPSITILETNQSKDNAYMSLQISNSHSEKVEVNYTVVDKVFTCSKSSYHAVSSREELSKTVGPNSSITVSYNSDDNFIENWKSRLEDERKLEHQSLIHI